MLNLDYIQLSVLTSKYIIFILLIRKYLYKYLPKSTISIVWYILIARLCIPFTFEYKIPTIIEKIVMINENKTEFINSLNPSRLIYLYTDNFIPRFYRVIIIVIIISYFIYIGVKQTLAINLSNKLDINLMDNKKISDWLEEKNKKLKFRKIEIYTNKKIIYPITYGIFSPKIIIPISLIKDIDILLILEHEFTHIKRWDILYTYIINLTFCIHIFNPVIWFMCSKIQDDIEILCDYMTIKRVGESKLPDYMRIMLKLYTREHLEDTVKKSLILKMSSTKERMILMKSKRKATLFTTIAMSFLIILSSTSFASPIVKENIELNDLKLNILKSEELNNNIHILSKSEFNNIKPVSIDEDENVRIGSGSSKRYEFDMNSWFTKVHTKLIVGVSNISSSGTINYNISVFDFRGNELYSNNFRGEAYLDFSNFNENRKYTVMITNFSSRDMKCDVKLKSYY